LITDYQLSALSQIWIVLLVPLATTILYWYHSKSQFARRVITSSHGLILLTSFLYAVAVCPITGLKNYDSWIIPFWLILILYLISLVVSLLKFEGNKIVHIALIAEIISAFLIWLVGTMTITHDWM